MSDVENVLPPGFVISRPREARGGLYRDGREPSAPTVIEHRWRHQFGCAGVFLAPWGTWFMLGGLFACLVREGWQPEPPPIVFGVAMFCLGLAGLYVGLANLVNRTRVVVSGATVTRELGPLPWRGHAICACSPTLRVEVKAARRNDIRRGGFGPNPPERYEVVLVDTGAPALVLFEQVSSRSEAEVVQGALRAALVRAGQ